MNSVERGKKWRLDNPERVREYAKISNLRKFNLTMDEYNNKLLEQGGVCAICGGGEIAVQPQTGVTRNLAVDHCHITGNIRGLLCMKCNTIVGHVEREPELVDNIIDYLNRY